MSAIRLDKLVKAYGATTVVKAIDLEIAAGELIVLVGPSGCGKTTTLRMIAGLEEVTAGAIMIDDERVNDVAPKHRDIAMVFQSYALYPHMSVYDNMAFGLKLKGLARAAIAERIARAAEILGLGDLLERKPRHLSGGQRQRVAMGRAIVRDPRVFLFDEPLSNLDAKLRLHMRTEIKRLHQRLGATTIYVTHDQVEAMTLADRIVVMNDGRIEQIATPQEMYEAPATRFVAGFIGSPPMNLIDCRLEGAGAGLELVIDESLRLAVPPQCRERYRRYAGRPMVAGLRPEHLAPEHLGAGAPEPGAAIRAVAEVVEPLGMETLVYLRHGTRELCARVAPGRAPKVGETMDLAADLDHLHLIDPASDLVV